MEYPHCPVHTHVQLKLQKKGWYYEECDRSVVGYDQVPRPSVGAVPQASSPVVARWPSVLALALHEYQQEEHPVLKLWHACDVVELTLRFLVMIGVAEAARGGELPEPLARQLWEKIERPVLGHWRGMAETLVKAQEPEQTLVPEARAYLFDILVPLLDGSSHPRTTETSFARLRNLLAHGAGVTKAMARRLLGVWQPRFEAAMVQGAWLGELSLVVRDATGAFAELRGSTTKPAPLITADSEALSAASITSDSILLVREGRVLALWPLAVYGEPRAADSRPTGLGDTAQVYVRRGEVRLEYTPLGSEAACEAVGDQTTLDAFQRIFRLDRYRSEAMAKGFSVRGFERELRKDSDQLVGRGDETEKLRRVLDETVHGVIWVSGLAGVGKSFMVARVVSELIEAAADDRLVLPYRFRIGDAERCSREAFLRFAIERLEAWLGVTTGGGEEDRFGGKPLERLRQLIEKVPSHRQVVFVLDGMDELAQRDPDFAREVPLALRLRGVVWLCTGRPERGLPEAFRKSGALEPFPDGLPRMSAGDIRTMLLEKIGPLRRKLLKGDRDDGDRVVNPFIERVAKNAEGLPIYVKYVIGDVLQGKLSPEPGETRLPPSLAAYHEELLRRCSVGDLNQVLTPLVATLAVAKEPLTAEELTALLVRRTILTGGDASLDRVRQALSAIASMVDLAPDPDGGEGYTLWHESLREHLLQSSSSSEAVGTARHAMAEAGLRPAGDAAERYLYRQGISHLLDEKRRDEALVLMTDLAYLMGRLDALPGSQGPAGLSADWCAWLIPSERREELVEAAACFGERLGAFCNTALEAGGVRPLHRLTRLLLWHATPTLDARLGGAAALAVAARQVVLLAERLAALDPDNTDFLRDLSVSFGRMGRLHERTDSAKARQWYLKGLDIAERLATLQPDNTTFLHDLSISFEMMGGSYERTDPAKARQWYLKSLEIRQRLAALEPDDTDFLHSLSISFMRMGGLDKRTDSAKARQWYLKGLEIRQRLAALEPDNTTFLRDLSVSFVRMGGLDERTDPAKARQLYLKGLEIAERLATLEPDNNTFLHDLSVFFGRMGGLDERRDPAKAREWYLKGLDIRQRLAALEPDNTTFLCDLSISCVNLGELALRLGCDDPGVWFDRAIPIRRTLVAQEPEDADLWERLARACHLRGAWGLRQNRGDEHGGFRDECFQALDRAEVIASPTAQTGYLRACACALAGDSQAALAALAQAVERGYDDADEALDERDLETLRSDPRFQELIAEMRRRRSGSVLRS